MAIRTRSSARRPRGTGELHHGRVLCRCEDTAGDNYDPENAPYTGWEDLDDEQYLFLAEGDLDEIMDEQDVMAALAAYQDTRQALKDQRLSRGYFPGGKGKGSLALFRKGKTRASAKFTSSNSS